MYIYIYIIYIYIYIYIFIYLYVYINTSLYDSVCLCCLCAHLDHIHTYTCPRNVRIKNTREIMWNPNLIGTSWKIVIFRVQLKNCWGIQICVPAPSPLHHGARQSSMLHAIYIMLYNAIYIYIYDTRIHICIMDICVNLKKSLKRSKQFYIISFPQVWKFFWPRPQAPQARPWQERDHGMRYGREALGAKVIACQYLPALSLRGQPKAWKQRKASAPRQQRLWNTFHSLYNIYVYIYIYVIYMFSYKYIYIFIYITTPWWVATAGSTAPETFQQLLGLSTSGVVFAILKKTSPITNHQNNT